MAGITYPAWPIQQVEGTRFVVHKDQRLGSGTTNLVYKVTMDNELLAGKMLIALVHC